MVLAIGWLPMFRRNIFFRYFILGGFFSIIFFLLVLVATQLLNIDSITDVPGQGQLKRLSEILASTPPLERVNYLKQNETSQHRMRPFEFSLSDDKGKIIFPENKSDEIIDIHKANTTPLYYLFFSTKEIRQIKELNGSPKQFLIFDFDLDSTNEQLISKKRKFLTLLAVLSSAMILCLFASLFLIFILLRGRAKHLDRVINELKNGNLKARLPIGKMDEIGLMMSRFNQMADEIENLVTLLKKAESTRKDLLQELAHDLRTPISSLKILLEMSYEKKHMLSEEKKDELLTTALSEIEYFFSLVNDLLFLGQIKDPKYDKDNKPIKIIDLIHEEINLIKPRFPNIELKLTLQEEDFEFTADEKLIRRFLRNLLENSFSFARNEITLNICREDQTFIINIVDNGPGFTEESLAHFGKKSSKRSIPNNQSRISIGLGSVIMKSIAESYGGALSHSNLLNEQGQIKGAKIEASFIIS